MKITERCKQLVIHYFVELEIGSLTISYCLPTDYYHFLVKSDKRL